MRLVVTTPVTIPVVNSIMRLLEVSDADAGMMKMKREMLASHVRRYKGMESNEYFALATLLDPRLKQRVFSSTSSGAYVRQMLISSYETLDSQEFHRRTQILLLLNACERRVKKSRPSSLLWRFCNELIDEKSESESSPKLTQSVIDGYLNPLLDELFSVEVTFSLYIKLTISLVLSGFQPPNSTQVLLQPCSTRW